MFGGVSVSAYAIEQVRSAVHNLVIIDLVILMVFQRGSQCHQTVEKHALASVVKLLSTVTRSLRLSLELRRRISGYPISELISRRLIGWIACKILKLIGVVSMVVEFPWAIFINDQSPITTADSVIAKV